MSTYSSAALNFAPVGYWRQDEASGTVAADSSGNGHTGTLAGTITYSVPGALPSDSDTALGYTSTGSLNLPTNLGIDGWSGFTLIFWGRPSSRWQMVVYTCDSSGNERVYLNGYPYLAGGSGDTFVLAADLSCAGFVGAGNLDEVELLQTVLTPAQITTLWLAAGYRAPTPTYYLTARDNTTLLVVAAGIERDYENFTCIKRWNDVGTWTLQLRRESRFASLFKPDSSGNMHTGLIFSVDYEDGNGLQQILSGPQTAVDVSLDENNQGLVVASGKCDNVWLQRRISLPFAGFPYESDVILGHSFAPARYYTFGDASGTVATDLSTAAQNGTYHGTVTLGQAALIDDPPTSVLLNGTNGYISVPTTGLPSGNNPFSLAVWGMLSANPSGSATAAFLGTIATNEDAEIGINSSGKPFFLLGNSGVITGATAITLGVPFFLVLTWDGTTARGFCFQNGNANQGQFGSSTPGAANITYGAASFGAIGAGAGNFWPGTLAHGTIFSQDMSARLDVRNLYPWPTWAYRVGLSKLAFVDYATSFSQGAQASFDIDVFAFANLTFPSDRAINGNWPTPTDTGTTTQTFSRFDNILTLCQTIALRSTPQLTFKMEQSAGQYLFTIFFSPDRTKTAVFSLDRKNIRAYSWHYEAAKANYVYAGGVQTVTGVPESRVFAEGGDSTSIGQFGRVETFLDDRSAPDQATLRGAITAALAENAAIRSFAVTTRDTANLYFKGPGDVGYDVGDLVTVILDGQVFEDVVREVTIDLQPGALPVVTPTIGTPNGPQRANANSHVFHEIESNANATTSIAINY